VKLLGIYKNVVFLVKINTMKKVVFALIAIVCFASCSKKSRYLCTGTYKGQQALWRPSDGEITKKELNASIKHSEELGYTNINCVVN
jgi:hypothetical protein